jgi:hypothetical protein
MTKITIDLSEVNSEALKQIACGILDNAGLCGKGRGTRMDAVRNVDAIIRILETRASAGDFSELCELNRNLRTIVEMQRIKPERMQRGDDATLNRDVIRTFRSRSLGKVTIPE